MILISRVSRVLHKFVNTRCSVPPDTILLLLSKQRLAVNMIRVRYFLRFYTGSEAISIEYRMFIQDMHNMKCRAKQFSGELGVGWDT